MSEPGFEKRDINPGAIGAIAVTLVLGVIFSSIVMALFFTGVSLDTQREEGRVLPPIPKTEERFPKPQLQVSPPVDLAEMRKREDAVLNGYRWIDRQAGIVGIPIDRAMDLLVKTGSQPVLGTPGLPVGPTWLEMMQRRAMEGAAAQHREEPVKP